DDSRVSLAEAGVEPEVTATSSSAFPAAAISASATPSTSTVATARAGSTDGATDAAAEDGVPTLVIHRGDDVEPPEEEEARDDRVAIAAAAAALHAQQTYVSDGAPGAPPSEALQRALQKMREVFRIRDLRPGQAEIIESVLA